MKKQSIIIISIAVIVLIAVFTNPNVQTHREAVKTMYNQNLQKHLVKIGSENNSEMQNGDANFGMILGNVFIDKIIGNIVTSDNYVLFSITKLSLEGKSKMIGFGLFGNVFISNKVNNALKNDSDEEKALEEELKKSKEQNQKDLEGLE